MKLRHDHCVNIVVCDFNSGLRTLEMTRFGFFEGSESGAMVLLSKFSLQNQKCDHHPSIKVMMTLPICLSTPPPFRPMSFSFSMDLISKFTLGAALVFDKGSVSYYKTSQQHFDW